MNRRCHCGCPPKQIVHPVQSNVVHCCSEETVKHIHPSHTTVVNHHLIKNEHVYPHSTSFENTVNEVDVFGGAFNVPPGSPGQVAGATSPGVGPGLGQGIGPGIGPGPGRPPYQQQPGQVGGAMSPGFGHKPNKWC